MMCSLAFFIIFLFYDFFEGYPSILYALQTNYQIGIFDEVSDWSALKPIRTSKKRPFWVEP